MRCRAMNASGAVLDTAFALFVALLRLLLQMTSGKT